MLPEPKILIVDDEEIVRRNIEQILAKEGVKTFMASDGEEAIKMIQDKDFDLVLTDLVMQDVNGMQVLEEVKRVSPETVVIIITGYGSLGTAVQAMQKGAYDYLVKPCDREELLLRVNKGIERHHLERKLNEMKRVETLMSNIGIFTLDLNGIFLHSNSNLSKRLWDMSSLDGKSIYDLPSIVESGIKEGFQQALEGKNVDSDLVRYCKESSKEEFILSIHLRPVKGEKGEPKVITLIIEEISQRIRLIEKISQAERLAALGKLAAGVAHEINNPLNIISLDVEFMKSQLTSDDPSLENLNSIGEEVDRIAHIVQQLQDHVKLREGASELIDLNRLFQEHIFTITFDQLSRRQVVVNLELSDNLPRVQIPKAKLTQVIMNLIKNADDAMGDKGELTISTQPVLPDKLRMSENIQAQGSSSNKGQWNFVEIKIRDTGAGIEKKHLNCLFEPFFTTKGLKGTGLGLFISYSIIKSYNGSISVSSTPGSGTVFSVVLPAVLPEHAPRPS